MKQHSPKELRYAAKLIDADGVTVLAQVHAGVTDLSGARLKESQLQAAESTHMLVMRAPDAAALNPAGYVLIGATLYVVDYTADPRLPLPGMWLEVFCHLQRGNA